MAINNKNIDITTLDVSTHPQFMDHDRVYKIRSEEHDVTGYIGVHNSALGPALGGIRYKHYDNEHAALKDVLRLSEAMTWKNSAGGLDHGGGKSVILAPKGSKTPNNETLEVMAEALNMINAQTPIYYGAQDMNMSEASLDFMYNLCPWIKGATNPDTTLVSGTPSPITATGVYECIKRAVKFKLGKDNLEGVRIAMQGLGTVGAAMADHLLADGAILIGCDMADAPFENRDIERVGLDEIYDVNADIFAPNAIGGTINDETIKRLHAAEVKIICGAANNQQADQIGGAQSKTLHDLGILYCPDYIVNAGGVIWVAKVGENASETIEDIRRGVPQRFEDVLNLYKDSADHDMHSLSSAYARKRVNDATNADQLKAG